MLQLACSLGAATSFSFPALRSYQQAADELRPGIIPPSDVTGAYAAADLSPGHRLKYLSLDLGLGVQ